MLSLHYKFAFMIHSKGFQAMDSGKKTGMFLKVKKVSDDIWTEKIDMLPNIKLESLVKS